MNDWRCDFMSYLKGRTPETEFERAKTHITEIFRLMSEGLGEFGRLTYLSIEQRELKFPDGKTYVVTVEEKR